MRRSAAWRQDALALLVLLAIPSVLTADILFGTTFYYRDLTRYFYGSDRVFREIVSAGVMPFWNPYFAGGQPLAANPEFSTFYPLRWLVLLPDFRLGFNLQLLLHLHVALAGMYLLLRSMRLGVAAAAFGALAFGIGGFTCSYVNIPPFLFTLAWVPFVMMFARLLVVSPSRLWFVLTAVCFGLQNLAGEPTGILQTGMLAGGVLLHECLRQRERRAEFLIRRGGLLAGAFAAGVLLGAVQVFGTLDLVRDTARADGLPFSVVRRWSMPPIRFFELFFPSFMGHKADAGLLYWGVTAYASGEGPYILDLYVGYLTAVLALCGVFARQREWALWTSLAAISFLISVGDHTPLLKLLHQWGVFRAFRYPEKFLLLGMVALIIQSAVAFDGLMKGDRRIIRIATAVAGVVAAFAGALLIFTFTGGYEGWLERFWSIPSPELTRIVAGATRVDWTIALGRAVIALLLVAYLLRWSSSRTWLSLAALFVLYDLGTTSNRDLPRLEHRYFDAPPAVAQLRDLRDERLFHEADLREQEFGVPASTRGEQRYWAMRDGLYPKLPALWGIATVLESDYDVTHLRPTRDLYTALLVSTKLRGGSIPEVFLQVSNVGAVASHASRGIEFRRVGPYPRYYFARRIVPVRDLHEFISAARIDAWQPGDAFVHVSAPPPSSGEVVRAVESFNGVDLDVRNPAAGLLIIGITSHRYWSAEIDGIRAQLLPANIGYQSVIVPAGARRVSLRYFNPVIAAGAAVSALSLIAVVIAALPRRRLQSG